jgi:hypothetical protein
LANLPLHMPRLPSQPSCTVNVSPAFTGNGHGTITLTPCPSLRRTVRAMPALAPLVIVISPSVQWSTTGTVWLWLKLVRDASVLPVAVPVLRCAWCQRSA